MLTLEYAAQDGITHVNIDERATTKLGRALVIQAKRPFIHPRLGNFQSVDGLLNFIKRRGQDDMYRFISGAAITKYKSQVKPGFLKDFGKIVMDGLYWSLRSTPDVAEEIASEKLPFERYYVMDTGVRMLPIRPPKFQDTLDQANTVRDLFRTDTQSDFDYDEYLK